MILAVALYNHYLRLRRFFLERESTRFEKSNIILIGPSGSGKTLLAKTLASLLKVPFAICDATTLTEAGYVGDDVENVIHNLLESAEGNINKAECGIIFLDEIDKLAKRVNFDGNRDVGGEGVQQALLKMLEGKLVNITLKGRSPLGSTSRDNLAFDTSKVLFILSGAFIGMDKFASENSNSPEIGFKDDLTAKENDLAKGSVDFTVQDLISYGMIPEFVGRVPIIAKLDQLDEKTLLEALIKPKNSILLEYQELLSENNLQLEISESALAAIAHLANETGTGARGLRAILEKILLPVLYEAPNIKGSKIIFEEENILNDLAPRIEKRL